MTYAILLERVEDEGFPPGYYYAHIPSLGLTTHGLGIAGARQAAGDLLQQWIAEKRAHHEPVPSASEFFFSTVEVPDNALQSA
jgi:predicted RNase H-like HicB family nuclease